MQTAPVLLSVWASTSVPVLTSVLVLTLAPNLVLVLVLTLASVLTVHQYGPATKSEIEFVVVVAVGPVLSFFFLLYIRGESKSRPTSSYSAAIDFTLLSNQRYNKLICP